MVKNNSLQLCNLTLSIFHCQYVILSLFYHFSFTILPSKSFFHNFSFKIFHSQTFFHKLFLTIFSSQTFFHNFFSQSFSSSSFFSISLKHQTLADVSRRTVEPRNDKFKDTKHSCPLLPNSVIVNIESKKRNIKTMRQNPLL